ADQVRQPRRLRGVSGAAEGAPRRPRELRDGPAASVDPARGAHVRRGGGGHDRPRAAAAASHTESGLTPRTRDLLSRRLRDRATWVTIQRPDAGLAMIPRDNRIDFISAYCDRWCDRCAYTARCSAYACDVAAGM